MFGKKATALIIIISLITVLRVIAPVVATNSIETEILKHVNEKMRTIQPLSKEMVDQAIIALSKGWTGMSSNEKEAFLLLYDPADTGDIDDEFLDKVLDNYRKIREVLDEDIRISYEPESSKCEGMRLYFIDLATLHICPYFLTEPNEVRQARTFIHEMAHKALLVTDRPYYRPTSKVYKTLTPNGSWAAQLPVIGRVVREIAGSDTLYHPDAYAHYALAVSGQPGSELYQATIAHDLDSSYDSIGQSETTGNNATESWTQVTDVWASTD